MYLIVGIMILMQVLMLTTNALAMTPSQPKPTPTPTQTVAPRPSQAPTPTPTKTVKKLVTLGVVGTGVDAPTVQRSLDLLNEVYASGCMEKKLKNWSIPYLTTADGSKAASKQAAFDRYVKQAPYALDIRWYKENSTVMGYTYNWKMLGSGATDKTRSETRIWTNRTNVTGPKTYAAHLAHELSHQVRAGGYVHWTQFKGTVPYEFGDIAFACLEELPQGRSTFSALSIKGLAPAPKENWKELRTKGYKH